jgi:hypothetical protein
VPGGKTPTGYVELLEDLKDRIRHAQIRAATAVSRELNLLYFEIGQRIVERQEREGWGARVINRLARDPQAAFPGQSGLSRTSIHRMRAFYVAYTKEVTKVPQPVGQSRSEKVPQAVGQFPEGDSAQHVPGLDAVNLPQPVAEIPWGHNVVLLEKLADPLQRGAC